MSYSTSPLDDRNTVAQGFDVMTGLNDIVVTLDGSALYNGKV
jgi:hypothetical protein